MKRTKAEKAERIQREREGYERRTGDRLDQPYTLKRGVMR